MNDEVIRELLLAPELFPGVISGQKTCTVRTRHRNIQRGCLALQSSDGSIVHNNLDKILVLVTKVRHTKLCDLTMEELIGEGMEPADYNADINAMREAFRQDMAGFYPDITLQDDVTVIHFTFTNR